MRPEELFTRAGEREFPMRRVPMPVLIVLAVAAIALGFVLAGPKPPKDEQPAEPPPS